jgi:hypothetical protein
MSFFHEGKLLATLSFVLHFMHFYGEAGDFHA